MAKVLLINPSYQPSYGSAKAAIVNPIHPTLGLATIGASALAKGHKVEVLDLSWRAYDPALIRDKILDYKPDVVGITATTPLMNQLRDMSVLVKDISWDIAVWGGGAHPSALPYETMRESLLDAVFVGEADFTFAQALDAGSAAGVPGVHYRDGEDIIATERPAPIENLDDLPIPAWELYKPEDYRRMSRLLCRRTPVTMAEFSRGCVFKCDFCASKITMAQGYRKKSPERCAEEVARIHALGFREFMLADDIFTSDQKWAGAVCDAISARKLDMLWTCSNGVRVESADEELFAKLRRAGCYRVSFGFESGNDSVLKLFGKGGRASIEQGKTAVRMARKAGIDTTGFFMLGLSPDTCETMQDTIDFASQLPLDMMKFGISIAFPGTAMFNAYVAKGLIRSFNWDDYFIYTDEPLFAHENLTYDEIQATMDRGYKQAMTRNPAFMVRRLWHGLRTGGLFWDAYYALYFFLSPAVSEKVEVPYYARDRWPVYDFAAAPPRPAAYPVVRHAKAS